MTFKEKIDLNLKVIVFSKKNISRAFPWHQQVVGILSDFVHFH